MIKSNNRVNGPQTEWRNIKLGVDMSSELIKKLSFETFVEIYNLKAGYETPRIHTTIARWLDETRENPSRLLQVFRHAGKSHLFSLYVCWRLTIDPDYTCIIISAKRDIAARNSRFIRDLIAFMPVCTHLRVTGKVSQLNFTVHRTSKSLDPSVTVTSLESDYTGKHAQELIIDDIETSDNCNSEEARVSMRNRIYEFRKLASKILFCGTPHNRDSIYNWLQDKYGVNEILCIPIIDNNNNLAWPDHPEVITEVKNDNSIIQYSKFSHEWIDFIKNTTPINDFKSQYLLIPVSIDASVLSWEMIAEYESEPFYNTIFDSDLKRYITHASIDKKTLKKITGYMDTASGKEGRDKSVLAIVAQSDDPMPVYYILQCIELVPIDVNSGWLPMLEQVVEIVKEYKLEKLCFEKSANYAFEAELRTIFNKNRVICGLKEINRTLNKTKFIISHLQPIIDSGRLKCHKSVKTTSNFWGELRDFPHSRHDDSIDAVAGAISDLSFDTYITHKKIPDRPTFYSARGNDPITKY